MLKAAGGYIWYVRNLCLDFVVGSGVGKSRNTAADAIRYVCRELKAKVRQRILVILT